MTACQETADLARGLSRALSRAARSRCSTPLCPRSRSATAASRAQGQRQRLRRPRAGHRAAGLERLRGQSRTGRSTGSPPGAIRSRSATRCAAYAVDSVLVSLTLVARDTLVDGLKVYLYRLPSTVDSTVTFAGRRIAARRRQPHRQHRRARHAQLRRASIRPCAARTWTGCGLPAGGDSVLAIGLRMAAVLADRDPRRRAGGRARRPPSPATSRWTCRTPARSATRR